MRRASRGNRGRVLAAQVVVAISMLVSSASYGQGAPPPGPEPAGVPQPPGVPSVEPAPPAPPPPAAPPPVLVAGPQRVEIAEPAGDDFDPNQRRWALGYAGVSQVPTGAGTLTVPAIGVRYWASPSTGVDAAAGVSWTGGSTEAGGVSTDKNSQFGIIVQGGVPLALSVHRHVNFEVIPYLTFAYGKSSTGTGATEVDFYGLRLDVGARAGFELFFGFIGIPQLALSATVGLQFEYVKLHAAAPGGNATSDNTTAISTTVQNNPWDIFAGNVAARYYF